ncbi:hypothetical protein DL93DRAFT_1181836 [Clavulina sp. PMI_390]|nr:hypothetical protein DL93DRAFT_1181836 [Clavulina sp. PMI_390]
MSNTRRSNRIAAKAVTMLNPTSRPSTKQVQTHITTNVPEDESDGSYFSESQHEGAIIGKRKRKAPRAIKGAPAAKRAKGKLSALLTMMPNEVMAEICTHLQPVDLLNLVQSAKIFALFLLTQGSAPIWRSARFQLDSELPDCPIDLKEQKYACLIFGNYCQRCGVRGCKATHLSLLWGVRRRWCTRCQRSVGLNLGGRSEYIEVMKPRHHVFDELVRAASLHGSRPIHIAKRSDHEAVLLELYQFSGDSDALKAYEASLKAVVKQDHINNSMLLQWIEGRAQERSHNLSETRTQRIGEWVHQLFLGFLIVTHAPTRGKSDSLSLSLSLSPSTQCSVRAHLERSGFSRIRINAIPDDEFRVLPEMKHAKRVTEKGKSLYLYRNVWGS